MQGAAEKIEGAAGGDMSTRRQERITNEDENMHRNRGECSRHLLRTCEAMADCSGGWRERIPMLEEGSGERREGV